MTNEIPNYLISAAASDTMHFAKRIGSKLFTLNLAELSFNMEGNEEAKLVCMECKLVCEKLMARLVESTKLINAFSKGLDVSEADIRNIIKVNADIDIQLKEVGPVIDNLERAMQYM